MDVLLQEEADAREADDLNSRSSTTSSSTLRSTLARGRPCVARLPRARSCGAHHGAHHHQGSPQDTLALAKFAGYRFDKVVIFYDGFGNWITVPPIRVSDATSLWEIRWLLESEGIVVMLLEKGDVAELEEQFGSGRHVEWDFNGLNAVNENRTAFRPRCSTVGLRPRPILAPLRSRFSAIPSDGLKEASADDPSGSSEWQVLPSRARSRAASVG